MAFIFAISKKSFKGQLPGEETIFVTRKHWFVLFVSISFIFPLALLPFVIYFFISKFPWYAVISSLFQFLMLIYFLILWILLFYTIMLYILTVMVVTNKRVIRIEQKAFFKYESAETPLEKIQDVSAKIEDFFGTFLNFGKVEIQTAGTLVKFTFFDLPNPEKIKKIIMDLIMRDIINQGRKEKNN